MLETLDTQSQTANTWECCEECTVVKKITDTDSVLGGASQSHCLLNRTCEDLFKATTKKRKKKMLVIVESVILLPPKPARTAVDRVVVFHFFFCKMFFHQTVIHHMVL